LSGPKKKTRPKNVSSIVFLPKDVELRPTGPVSVVILDPTNPRNAAFCRALLNNENSLSSFLPQSKFRRPSGQSFGPKFGQVPNFEMRTRETPPVRSGWTISIRRGHANWRRSLAFREVMAPGFSRLMRKLKDSTARFFWISRGQIRPQARQVARAYRQQREVLGCAVIPRFIGGAAGGVFTRNSVWPFKIYAKALAFPTNGCFGSDTRATTSAYRTRTGLL
jgi:hypothetical protein